MNLKPLFISLSSAFLLAACGGAPEDLEQASTPSLPDPSSSVVSVDRAPGEVNALWTANCAGWVNGARTCSWKCRSSSEWMWALQNVGYGDCTAYATSFCGRTPYDVCWSSNPHP